MSTFSTPFNFYSPTRLVFGPGTTKGAGALVAGLGVKSELLVCGSGATGRAAGFAALKAELDAGEIA